MVMGDQGALCGLPWPVCPVDLGQRLSSRAGTAWCPSCGRRWPLDAVEPTIQNGGGKLLRRLVDGKLRSVQHAPQVGLEAFVVVGQELVGDAKESGEGFALLVVVGALLAVEGADELVDHLEGDHDQGGVDPQGKLGVAGPVAAPGGEASGGGRQPALYSPVDLADPGGGRKSLLVVAEDDRQGDV